MSLTNYGDVHLFHRKMGLLHPKIPQLLPDALYLERVEFIYEELDELLVAYANADLPKAFDALIDLVYVIMGTGVMMGLPWQAGWDAVQYANIRKERDTSKDTEHHKGVIKPPGWTPPDLQAVLAQYSKIAKVHEAYTGDESLPANYRPPVGPQRAMRLSGGPNDPVVDFPISEPATLASERCMVCGLRYDEHDGTEEHRFK